jgi:DnaJ like chaperone protein
MYLGKLIGFFMGMLVYGPLGGVVGVVAGHVFDRGVKKNMLPRGEAVAIQNIFFKATFSVLGHVAKTDGRVTKREIEVVEGIMRRLKLNQQQRKIARMLFSEGKQHSFHLESELYQLYEVCHRQRDVLRLFIQFQLETALAEGTLAEKEKAVLLTICRLLRFSPEAFAELQARQRAEESFHQHYQNRQTNTGMQDSLEDAYGVLGVTEQATNVQIKKAYRKLMSQYHPDKLVSKGLPPEMLLFAKEKTQEIQAAYEMVNQKRGI